MYNPNYKPPRRKHRAKALQRWIWRWFLVYDNKGPGNSNKNRWTGLHDASEIHQKTHQQSEKTTCEHLQNIFKSSIWSGIRDLISRICREPVKLNHTKNKQPYSKMGKRLNSPFSKEDVQMVNKHINKCSTWLITGEKQMRTTWDTPSHQPHNQGLNLGPLLC